MKALAVCVVHRRVSKLSIQALHSAASGRVKIAH
jgi:hypothetical protein